MTDRVAAARLRYARGLRARMGLHSEALVRAFATVPREAFFGPGPWQLFHFVPGEPLEYRMTPDADPVRLYEDVLVGIDPARFLNNGQPSFVAFMLQALDPHPGEHVVHLGCGTGYYTAILAELVGPSGRVTALEVDGEIAARARTHLAERANVRVVHADGTTYAPDPADGFIMNAGVSHPQPVWLDCLRPGARAVLPLTVGHPVFGVGQLLALTRVGRELAARFVMPVAIFPCVGGRDEEAEAALARALERGGADAVRWLRRDAHEAGASCWLHGRGYCFSTAAPRAGAVDGSRAPGL